MIKLLVYKTTLKSISSYLSAHESSRLCMAIMLMWEKYNKNMHIFSYLTKRIQKNNN